MTSDNSEKQSPFTRPGFIVAAIVVGLIVVCGIILAVIMLTRPADPPEPTPSGSAAPAPSPTAAEGGSSVCGLKGVELEGTVTQAPTTDWQYQDVYAYPTSPTAGPGETDPSGYRYCFQHTPDGALFAAGNITIMSFDPAIRGPWLDYVVSDGEYRSSLLQSGANSAEDSAVRASIAGFRMLSYSGDTATVDIAFNGSSGGQSVTGSLVAQLIWANGDWKLDGSMPEPARIEQLPNVAGYTSWTAG